MEAVGGDLRGHVGRRWMSFRKRVIGDFDGRTKRKVNEGVILCL